MSLIFGVTTVLAGILGVAAGSLMGQKLRRRFPTADAVVCGFGLLISVGFMFWGLMVADRPMAYPFTVLFFAQWFLNLNWALVGDILLVNWTTFDRVPGLVDLCDDVPVVGVLFRCKGVSSCCRVPVVRCLFVAPCSSVL